MQPNYNQHFRTSHFGAFERHLLYGARNEIARRAIAHIGVCGLSDHYVTFRTLAPCFLLREAVVFTLIALVFRNTFDTRLAHGAIHVLCACHFWLAPFVSNEKQKSGHQQSMMWHKKYNCSLIKIESNQSHHCWQKLDLFTSYLWSDGIAAPNCINRLTLLHAATIY